MKSKLTPEFLRGALFVFVVSQTYIYLVKGAWIGIYPVFNSLQFFPTLIFGSAYLIASICLFCFPQKTSKGIFIFLALFCLIPFLAAFAFADRGGLSLLKTPEFIWNLLIQIFWALTAYAYDRYTRIVIKAEQDAAANP